MKNPVFLKEENNFFSDLKLAVDNYFFMNNISYKANSKMFVKIILMFVIYMAVYLSIFVTTSNSTILFLIYAFMGAWSVLLGLNIGHDSAHNAIFKSSKNNRILLFIFEVLGTNAYNWKNRHLGAHHIFPNIMNHDSDIQQTNIVKIFPKDNHKNIHAFQHIYMPLIYMFYIFRWVVYRDFKDAGSKNIGSYNNSNYPRKELYKMILFKLFYLFYIVILPYIILPFSFLTILLAFFILTVAGSLVITLVLLSTHVGEDSSFPEPNQNGFMPHSWSYHQLITASDFGTESAVLHQLLGGFNHHVIHHLFPHICHIHYPALTPILKEIATKHNLPYRHKKYLFMAVLSHFKLLFQNSKNNATVEI